MKKEKKLFKSSIITAIFLASILMVPVNAVSITINSSVPTMQGYVALASRNKSTASSNGTVTLTVKDPDAVTFSARAKKSDGTWGNYHTGIVVSSTYKPYSIPYEYNLAAGTTVQARYRNHNWSLNSNQIEGTFDYK